MKCYIVLRIKEMLQSSVRKNSNSPLEISSNVQHQIMLITQKEKDDLTLYGSPAPTRSNRSATVKRAATLSKIQPESISNISIDDDSSNSTSKTETSAEPYSPGERYRKSLDSTYRHSLESISEYKTKHSFSSACLFPNRDAVSIESTTSDCTDYAVRSSTDVTKDKTLVSASSSYLSWIESVNSEYFGSANSTAEIVDIDNKVGEWNNFWLNYNSSNNRYLSSPFLYTSNDEKTLEDLSDCKSTCSTQREYTEKQTCLDQYFLSHDEITETIRCTQRITEILQNALKRTNENDFDESRNDSYYSQMFPALFSHFRKKEETPKERVRSYSLEPQELQKQKQMLKPPTQGGSSCINVLLNNGVADILKKVISRRREVITPDDSTSTPRNSFSEWSTTK